MSVRAAHLFVLLLFCGSCHVALLEVAKPKPAPHCGVERWAVKTLTDRDAGKVSLQATPTTIAVLRAMKAPAVLGPARIGPVERHSFLIHATLIAWKQEADRDFHLELQDGQGLTMIAEIPDPACMGLSPLARSVAVARQAVVSALGKPNLQRFVVVHRPVAIAGVGFFDFLHGQRGVAPNGIELHPVFHISFAPEHP